MNIEEKPKEKPRMDSSLTTWVVDMSDCTRSSSGKVPKQENVTGKSKP